MSARELKVLRVMAEGSANKEIAAAPSIGVGVRGRTEAVAEAVRREIISL